MAKRGRPLNQSWQPTSTACDRLCISRWTLATMRNDGTLKKGYHYRVKNPTAARLTYLWHCDRIQKLQEEFLTAD